MGIGAGGPHFDEAVGRLLAQQTRGSPFDSSDYQSVASSLTFFLRARFGLQLAAVDVEDIVQESITRFLEAGHRDRIDAGRSPAAYLTVIARNLALDRLRIRQEVPFSEAVYSATLEEDDAVAAMFRDNTTKAAVEAAMKRAASVGDFTAVRVVAAWLDLAHELGRRPSSREVSGEAGVSHTAVQDALERFRGYFPA